MPNLSFLQSQFLQSYIKWWYCEHKHVYKPQIRVTQVTCPYAVLVSFQNGPKSPHHISKGTKNPKPIQIK